MVPVRYPGKAYVLKVPYFHPIPLFKKSNRTEPTGIQAASLNFSWPGCQRPLDTILLAAPWSTRPLFSLSWISLHLNVSTCQSVLRIHGSADPLPLTNGSGSGFGVSG
jgi:hypothetical protein